MSEKQFVVCSLWFAVIVIREKPLLMGNSYHSVKRFPYSDNHKPQAANHKRTKPFQKK
jgi:hypothetical protein